MVFFANANVTIDVWCPVIQIMFRIITISSKICVSCPWILHNQNFWNRFQMLMWRKVMDQVTLSFTELTRMTKVVVEALCVLPVILLLTAYWNWQTDRQTYVLGGCASKNCNQQICCPQNAKIKLWGCPINRGMNIRDSNLAVLRTLFLISGDILRTLFLISEDVLRILLLK